MSRFNSSGSNDHHIKQLEPDWFRISWTVDRYSAGSRIRNPSGQSRDTDEAGAKRFAKKWDISMPKPKE